jgi:hypothetical protein
MAVNRRVFIRLFGIYSQNPSAFDGGAEIFWLVDNVEQAFHLNYPADLDPNQKVVR